jgi:hypothetical protein
LAILAGETDNPHVSVGPADSYWQWAQQIKSPYTLQFLFNIAPSKSFKSYHESSLCAIGWLTAVVLYDFNMKSSVKVCADIFETLVSCVR